MKQRNILIFSALLIVGCAQRPHRASLIVYGGTSAGVAAAVQAARMGETVILVSPDQHLGGLSSSGLGWTDAGRTGAVGGLAREFYRRIYRHYQDETAWRWQRREDFTNVGQGTQAIDDTEGVMWVFEPHAA
ncbi:FAD-dependent oxidoreductase, partial [bacterium]|nr:FAD-dependent oxidoreductase [bacterium]